MRANKTEFLIIMFFLIFTQAYCAAEEKKEDTAIKTPETADGRLAADIEKLSAENQAMNSDKVKLQDRLNAEKRDKEGAFGKYVASKNENTELMNKIRNCERDISELSALSELLEKQNKIASSGKVSESAAVVQGKTDFGKELKKAKDENAKLNRQVEGFKADLDKTKRERDEHSAQNNDLRKKVKDSTQKLSDADKTIKRLKANDEDAHRNLGVTFQSACKYDEAIKEYEKVLKINPDNADVSYNMALIYDTIKNNRKKAGYYYDRYLALNPQAKDAARVKERVTEISLESRVWGDPNIKGIGQKEKLGRW